MAVFKRTAHVTLVNEPDEEEFDVQLDPREDQSATLISDSDRTELPARDRTKREEEEGGEVDQVTLLPSSNGGIRHWIRRGRWKFWKKQKRYELTREEEESSELGRKVKICGRTCHLLKINSWRAVFLALFIFSVAMVISVMASKLLSEPPEMVKYNGAVSSDAAVCAEMSADILKQKGSAVDAAITTMLCNGVVHAESSGIGGGGFMVVRLANGSLYSINFRETAPMGSRYDMFHSNSALSSKGGLAVAVPGEIKGMERAHRLFGKLKWKKIFDPVIQLCKNGFKLTNHTVNSFGSHWKSLPLSIRNIYSASVNGTYKKVGDIVKRPLLAATLETISNHGADAFYREGDIARSIISSISSNGGIMTMEDLAGYDVNVETPLKTRLGNHTFYSPPAPSGGPVLLFILSLMDRFNLTSSSPLNLTYHRLVEAFKFGFAERTRLGDPYCDGEADPVCLSIGKDIAVTQGKMMNASFVTEVFKNISDDHTHNVSYYHPHFSMVEDHGTSHISVLGPDGDAVAVTTTVNTEFGSYLLTDTGIILNNEMDDFSSPNITNEFGLRPSRDNFIFPRRRPLSSTCPTIAVSSVNPDSSETRPYMVVGGSGGSRILTAVAQVILRAVKLQESISDSIESKRIHHQLLPDVIKYQADFPKEILQFLASRGHEEELSSFLSVVQGILVDKNGNVTAHADSRKQGAAVIVKK